MFDQPQIMRLAQAMTQNAIARQAIIAQNMANADTPGYRARDVAAYRATMGEGADPMRQTRRGHTSPGTQARLAPEVFVDLSAEAAPNGNSVSLEREMVRAAETRSQHDRALAVYKAGIDLMRAALGRAR